jgi:hypothetical protein
MTDWAGIGYRCFCEGSREIRGRVERSSITRDRDKGNREKRRRGGSHPNWVGPAFNWGTAKYNEHPVISGDAATKIVEAGIRILGVDTMSPDMTLQSGPSYDFGVHEVVLGSGCLIAENLTNLSGLSPEQQCIVTMAPLKMGRCDGSPICAFAQSKVRFYPSHGTVTHNNFVVVGEAATLIGLPVKRTIYL